MMNHFFTILNDEKGGISRWSTALGARVILCSQQVGITVYLKYDSRLNIDVIEVWNNTSSKDGKKELIAYLEKAIQPKLGTEPAQGGA